MPFRIRQTAAVALASLLAVGLFAPGCSQQGEGERCDFAKSGAASCEGGLVCLKKADLLDETSDRCCPPGSTFNDQRCTPKLGSDGSGGGQPLGTGGGGAGEATGGVPSDAGSAGEQASAGKAGEGSTEGGAGGAPANIGGEAGAASTTGGTTAGSGGTTAGSGGTTAGSGGTTAGSGGSI